MFLNIILANTANNVVLGAHGKGTKRLFSLYCGVNISLTKLARIMARMLGTFDKVPTVLSADKRSRTPVEGTRFTVDGAGHATY